MSHRLNSVRDCGSSMLIGLIGMRERTSVEVELDWIEFLKKCKNYTMKNTYKLSTLPAGSLAQESGQSKVTNCPRALLNLHLQWPSVAGGLQVLRAAVHLSR